MTDFKNLYGKNVLVIGGADLSGENLCEELLNNSAKVKCIDNFTFGKRVNLTSFLNNKILKLIEWDRRNLKSLQETCQNQDFVLHKSALDSFYSSTIDPIMSNKVTLGGCHKMVVAFKDSGAKRIFDTESFYPYEHSETFCQL